MKAGHLYLPDDQYDLTNKSGIYNLMEHYNNTNDIQQKNIIIDNIYEDFKTNNLTKYPYNYTENVIIINNDNANCLTAGLNKVLLPNQNKYNEVDYISFIINPKKDGILSFKLYNPNYDDTYQLTYCLSSCYAFYINSEKIDLNSIYIDNPQSFNYLFSHFNYNLLKDDSYTVKIEFNSYLYYCIEEQDLTITDIIFPYL